MYTENYASPISNPAKFLRTAKGITIGSRDLVAFMDDDDGTAAVAAAAADSMCCLFHQPS